jgi:outer membrane protein OmpA-like peptidoglycan-associated protein
VPAPVLAQPPVAAAAAAAPASPVAMAAPASPVAAAPAAQVAKIYFDTGKATLPASATADLAGVVEAAKANASAKLAVSGFHDASGDPAKNVELAKQRAQAVRDALKSAGIAEDRIEMKKPEEVNAGDVAEARRVEVTLQ